jgi:hypothetical protein
MVVPMSNIVGSAGMANCYLSKKQMTALLRRAEVEAVSRQQIVKRAVIKLLVEEGALEIGELEAVLIKQKDLADYPRANRKAIADLMGVRVPKMSIEEEQAMKQDLADLKKKNSDIRHGRTQPAVISRREARRRRRGTA